MDKIIPKVENNSVMKYIIKNFIDQIYFFEKKIYEKMSNSFFKKSRGGGVNFYLGPPFEIFSRKIFPEGGYTLPALPPCETLILIIFVQSYSQF
jgi:hypothetical protein